MLQVKSLDSRTHKIYSLVVSTHASIVTSVMLRTFEQCHIYVCNTFTPKIKGIRSPCYKYLIYNLVNKIIKIMQSFVHTYTHAHNYMPTQWHYNTTLLNWSAFLRTRFTTDYKL